MLDIYNKQDLIDRLNNLKVDSQPVFGKMSAQHMIEHLAVTFMISNGKAPQKLYTPLEKVDRFKAAFFHPENEFPMGIKAPVLPDEVVPLRYPDLPTAIQKFWKEFNAFEAFYAENPNAKPMHPVIAELSKEEWILFHNKHVTHHFKQHGLI